MGFVFPWSVWLKKELLTLCEQRIRSLSERSFINGPFVKQQWQRFLSGDKNIRWLDMWLCVVLEDWIEKNSITE